MKSSRGDGVADLDAIVAEVAHALNKAGVRYMVIGGVANAVWGRPRATTDIDIVIGIGAGQTPKILKALGKQIARKPDDPQDFVHATGIFPFDHRSGVRVEIIFGTLPFAIEGIERAVEIHVCGVPVRFCTPEDLFLHKIASDRERDRTDVEGIVRLRKASLDREYLEPRVRELAFILEKPEIEARYRKLMT